jgi:hypothetical protein
LEILLEIISKVTKYCNEQQKEIENNEKIRKIQSKLNLKDLCKPSRKLLFETKDDDKIYYKNNNICTIYLFNDLIIIKFKKFLTLNIKQINIDNNFNYSFDDNKFILNIIYFSDNNNKKKKKININFEDEKLFFNFIKILKSL